MTQWTRPGLSAHSVSGSAPHFGDGVGPHVGHEDVGAVGERLERAAAVVGGEVEHHAALVAVAVEEHRAHARVDVRAQAARDVAGGRFDLHDVGAEVGEQERCVRARHHRREIDHPHALEGQALHAPVTTS